GAGHRIAWDKVTVVHVFELFVEHYRLETRFCNPNSGNEKGSVCVLASWRPLCERCFSAV
ncbi:hypothetical protein FOZ75_10515, partial [Bifidobacterium longum]|uniref:hypothetical protein n=1 Tax=Bifidobacterium longum TaxID=216816 RepID=UPI0028546BCE